MPILDATGLRCPMPLLKLKLTLNSLAKGDSLTLLATDAGTRRDIPPFLAQAGHQLVSQTEEDGILKFIVIKQTD